MVIPIGIFVDLVFYLNWHSYAYDKVIDKLLVFCNSSCFKVNRSVSWHKPIIFVEVNSELFVLLLAVRKIVLSKGTFHGYLALSQDSWSFFTAHLHWITIFLINKICDSLIVLLFIFMAFNSKRLLNTLKLEFVWFIVASFSKLICNKLLVFQWVKTFDMNTSSVNFIYCGLCKWHIMACNQCLNFVCTELSWIDIELPYIIQGKVLWWPPAERWLFQ